MTINYNTTTIINADGVRTFVTQHNIIHHDYEKLRDKIYVEICNFLKNHENKGFTAQQLSEIFGLSSGSIGNLLSYRGCHDGITSRYCYEEQKFVKLGENNEIDYSCCYTRRIRRKEYFYR